MLPETTLPSPSALPAVLLVDDDPYMLEMQARMLRGMGYTRVCAAGGGDAALKIVQGSPELVDVILCDLNMPGMDGIEFLQILNARAFKVSVILLSGEGVRVMHTVQRLLGGQNMTILGGLEKPASPAQLRALLDRWRPPRDQAVARTPVTVTSDEIRTASLTGQWVLHYQPKVCLRTGALAGFEVLVRWQHPLHGFLYPDAFISIAEDEGEIDALTDCVLKGAMDQLAQWHEAGLHTQVAVNVSMNNLAVPGFAAHVRALARERSVTPQDITLEITESRLMSPSMAPLEALVRLRLQRFKLSIDDFGTGHSSLAQLRDIPFTELKVDRGFVRSARHNQIIRPILEGSIGIARRLELQSVAEGVETEEDWQLLRDIDCDIAQGYFIGRPMPMDQIPSWMVHWQDRLHELFRSA